MSLSTWFSEPTLIATASGEIAVAPVTLGRIPALARAVAPFVHALPQGDTPEAWVALVAEHGDAVIDALAIATEQPRTALEKLPLDQAAQLATAVVLVNLDFFAQRALPAITQAVSKLKTPGTV